MNRFYLAALLFASAIFHFGCQKNCKTGEDVDCWSSVLTNPEQVEKAIDNLKQIGDKKAEPALIEAFQSYTDQPENREKIAEIFRKWGTKPAVKPMIAAIDFSIGPSKEGRRAKWINRANQKIASALGAIGEQEAIPPLMRLMRMTKEPNVQRAAIRSLGELKAKEAVDELIKLSEDDGVHKIVRMNAIYAMGEIGDPKTVDSLVLSLYRDKAFYFFQAGLALVKIGEPAIDPLVQTMFGKNKEVKRINEENVEIIAGAMESNAAKVLGDIGSTKAVEPILQMVDTISKWDDETNRLLVATRLINALSVIGDKRGLKVPLKYLDKELWDVRTVCAMAINFISDRSALPEMLKYAAKGEHPKTRAPLIEAIGNLGTDAVLPNLQEMLNTQKDVTVHQAVEDSVKRIQAYAQCKENLDCWIGKLSDKEPAVREKTAFELGRLGDARAAEALIKIMDDQSENVRFAVIWAFDKLKSKKVIPAIEELVEREKDSTRFKVANYNYQLLAARLKRTGS